MSYSKILKSTGLLGSVQLLSVLISVVRNKAAAVLIGTVGMGLSDLYARTIELLANSTNFGLAVSGVRRLSVLHEAGDRRAVAHHVRLLRTWIFLAALLGALLTAALAPLVSLWMGGDLSHTGSVLLLAPAVALTTLTGGEIAVLRGIRRLKSIAVTSVLVAGCTLLIAVPLYLLWGLRSVTWVILLTTAATFAVQLAATWRSFPYRISPLRSRFVRSGLPLLRLGMGYIAAGICSSGAEMLVRTTLTRSAGGLQAAGLYAVGLTLTVSYARMVFVAMDADYFPRLSAACADRGRQNATVNAQIDVLVLLMTPLLLLLALCLPFLVRLLYSSEFLPVMPMVLAALPYMYFKAVYAPAAYLSLAHGDSVTYVVMEVLYDAVFIVAVVAGYRLGGLLGAGIGLSVANACDLCFIHLTYRRRYGLRLHRATLQLVVVQGLLLSVGLAAAAAGTSWQHRAVGAAALLAAALYGLYRLRRQRRKI